MPEDNEWPGYSDYESSREEFLKEVFHESGETFLGLIESLGNMAKAARALSDRAITLDFSVPRWPQGFYEQLFYFEQGVSRVREGFVLYCQALGIELEDPDLND